MEYKYICHIWHILSLSGHLSSSLECDLSVGPLSVSCTIGPPALRTVWQVDGMPDKCRVR